MTDALRHRGPDDVGTHLEASAALGFRRLAILDLSPEANQPIQVEDQVVSVFNGEIYNFRELRAELLQDGVDLRTQGDAEVIPHLYLRHGVAFVERLHGMFAIAVLDRRHHRLLLARDRFGKKPLYYQAQGDRVSFASEPKALLAGGAEVHPDAGALVRFLASGYVPGEGSAFSGLQRVPPGGTVLFDAKQVDQKQVDVRRYYTPPEPSPIERTLEGWKEPVFSALTRAVERRLQADVPVGVFLSGGIDSGLILAALRASGAPIPRTFTIGFDDPRFDERELAAKSARHLGVEPTVLVAAPLAEEALREITRVYDEPFGDASAYPTLLLSRLARPHVTVALSGDGGDEVFGGYRRHAALSLAERIARWSPAPARRFLASHFGEAGNGTAGRGTLGTFRRFASALGLDSAARNGYWSSFFRAPLRARFFHPRLIERAGAVDPDAEAAQVFERLTGSPLRRGMGADLLRYLPDDLLVKTDMASMSCSLEVRAPFLDHELVALAAGLGDDLLVRGSRTKVVLRALAEDHLPREVAVAPKRGFGVPLAAWLRGPLDGMAREWLNGERFSAREILREGAALELLDRHRSGREDWSSYLWLLLVLEAWHRRHVDADPEWTA